MDVDLIEYAGEIPVSKAREDAQQSAQDRRGAGGQIRRIPQLGGRMDVGAGAKILGGVILGDHAKIGVNAVVLTDVPGYCSAVGIPARILPRFSVQKCNPAHGSGLHAASLLIDRHGNGLSVGDPTRCPLASGNIVEDMRLGLDLAVAGHPPRFCSQAQVWSELPVGKGPAKTQRKRWEHGHLRTLLGQVPRLLGASVRQCRLDLLGLALELSVPPLSMLFLIWAAAVVGFLGLGWLLGIWLPALILTASGVAALAVMLAAWFKFGRATLPFSSLLAAPFYVLGKLPIYATFFLRPERSWIRTARTTHLPGNPGV